MITNTRPDMKIVREEIFGPVVVDEPFQSLDEIATVSNHASFGLDAGVWTPDVSKAPMVRLSGSGRRDADPVDAWRFESSRAVLRFVDRMIADLPD